MVAVVALVGVVRWDATEEPLSNDLVVPAQTWEGTSTQPSFDVEQEPIEIRALPAMPEKNQWEIKALPERVPPTFQPLPRLEGAENPNGEDFEFRSLPEIGEFRPLPSMDQKQLELPGDPQEAFEEMRFEQSKTEQSKTEESKTEESESKESKVEETRVEGVGAGQNDFFEALKLDDSQVSTTIPERSIPQAHYRVQDQPAEAVKPDVADLSIARRLRALPAPLTDTRRIASAEASQEFSVSTASAQLQIAAPVENAFKGVAIGGLPKELTARLEVDQYGAISRFRFAHQRGSGQSLFF